MSAMPVKPLVSAVRARSTSVGMLMRICGRKRWNSGAATSVEPVHGEVLVAPLERALRPVTGPLLDEVELVLLEAEVGREGVHQEPRGLFADVVLGLFDQREA